MRKSGKTKFAIARQPDDITCGPTCLHSIYKYYGETLGLESVIEEIPMLEGGGTLAVVLGCHALKRGYKSWIYSFNLEVFDPTWFKLDSAALIAKLEEQLEHKKKKKLQIASKAYIEFLKLGGQIRFHDLTASLIGDYLLQGVPILTGLSASYLYKSAREVENPRDDSLRPDDVRGTPQGHFVVLTSYDPEENAVTVADPYHPETMDYGWTYRINMEHLICSILLGVVTYDGNLLLITK